VGATNKPFMSILDSFVGIFAYSAILIPIIILVVTTLLYYYKPIYRLAIAIVGLVFGGLGLLVYSFVLFFSITKFGIGMTVLSTILVTVEFLTLYVGIKSFRSRGTKSIIGNIS
jgi:hypothetical protein